MESGNAVLDLSHNSPPPVPAVLDEEYRRAVAATLDRVPPGRLVGVHGYNGAEQDRAAAAALLARRLGARPDEGRIVVTNGVSSGLAMICQGIVGRGGLLAVEQLTYPGIRLLARQLGCRVVGLPMDADGMLPDPLAALCASDRPDAVFIVPTHHNPTTGTMPSERRQAIADIARRHRVTLIEDDIYSLLSPEAPPPLATLAPELTWYVMGLSKSVGPGMRLGYLVAPSAGEAARHFWPGVRMTQWMAAPMIAGLASTMIHNGGLDRLLAQVRAESEERRALALRTLDGFDVASAEACLHTWLTLPGDMPGAAVSSATRAAGVVVADAGLYTVDEQTAPAAIRIGLGNPRTQSQLTEALTTVVNVLETVSRQGVRRG
ncbi:aminotransferase-like domain-containing protein [Streptomyces sp. NPDC004752]